MVTELAAQLMPHPATQVNIRNGGNVENNNDEFQEISSQVSREQAAPTCPQRPGIEDAAPEITIHTLGQTD